MEEKRISPEIAYVKSLQIIALTLADMSETRRKMIELLKDGAAISLFVGLISMGMTGNPAGLVMPLTSLMAVALPICCKAFKVFRRTREELTRDKENLRTGAIDPRDYFEEKQELFCRNGKAVIIESLSDSTHWLSSEEKEMLAGFSADEAAEPLSSCGLLTG